MATPQDEAALLDALLGELDTGSGVDEGNAVASSEEAALSRVQVVTVGRGGRTTLVPRCDANVVWCGVVWCGVVL